MTAIPVSCNKDCGAGCPLVAHVEDGRIHKITDNPLREPHMIGCVRGYEMPRVVYASDRLKAPLLRVGDRGTVDFREISWPEALTRTTDGLRKVKETYGEGSIVQLGGSGSCRGALHNTARLAARFLSLHGTWVQPVGSYSTQAISFVRPFLFGGASVGIDPATLKNTGLILLWGANIVDTRFGCQLENWVRECRKEGTPVVVVDPRRSRTVEQIADTWIPVSPGTDTALMAAVLYELIHMDRVDRNFVDRYSVGFDELESYILGRDDGQPKTPDWAETLCATPAAKIRKLAGIYGNHKPAALIPGLSIQRTMGGEEAARMAVALQVATGNVGIPGGASGGNVWGRLPAPYCPSIDIPKPSARYCVPKYTWADGILEGKAGGYSTEIRGIYNVGGNYLSQGSDMAKNIRAFRKVDFAVCHDAFLTPTARHCDIVLPVTTFLEREDIVFPGINYLFYSNRAIEPLPEVRNDYTILCDLADILGFGQRFSAGRTDRQWLDDFLEKSCVEDADDFRRTGIYRGDDQERVGLSDFIQDPEGNPLSTKSGKIELASDGYGRLGFPRMPTCRILEKDPSHPLRLVSPHPRYRVHSQNSNISWFNRREDHVVWISSDDARSRGIKNGVSVVVSSEIGSTRIAAKVTDEIMPGVVCIHQGVWPEFDEDGFETAGSVNMLTSSEPTLPSQGSRTHSVFVEIEGE